MDFEKRNTLLKKIGDINDLSNYAVYVSIEEFFDGNDDLGSLWSNLEYPPSTMDQARDFLKEIRSKPEVEDLRVYILQFDGGEEWPASDTVLVVTDVSASQVRRWFKAFPPDEVISEEDVEMLAAIGHPNKAAVRLWWD